MRTAVFTCAHSFVYKKRSPESDIYLTYLLKCRPLRQYNKEELRAFSKPFLIQQIKTIQPKFIVCLGDTVVQVMVDDKEAHVKNLRGSWHVVLGYSCILIK
nr:uracil-DNA glycosylase family protein [Anaerocolumna aminovalerica]